MAFNADIDRRLITNEIEIACGAQGHVFRAKYRGKMVAVKARNKDHFDEMMLAKLQHPFIVQMM